MKLLVMACTVLTAIVLCAVSAAVSAEETENIMVEQSTDSPLAAKNLKDELTKPDVVQAESVQEKEKETIKQLPEDSQQHTVADFIIHPLIAFKPRVGETKNGKQAGPGTASTSAPWQLFNFNPGQGLGSSLAGWLGNRIQLPGLVETPVREVASTSTSTSTVKPDIIVSIQQRPLSTKKPLKTANNNTKRPHSGNKRPNRFNVNYLDDSQLNDEFGNFNRKRGNRRKYQEYEYEYDDDDDDDNDHNGQEDEEINYEEETEEVEKARPVLKQQNNQRRRLSNQQRKQLLQQQEESAEEHQYEDNDDDQNFYFNKNRNTKDSKNEQYINQRVQQIKQFNLAQIPAVGGNSLRKPQQASNQNKRHQQAIMLIRHKGNTYYVAPEILQEFEPANSNKFQGSLMSSSVPYKRKTQPSHYITLPWSQVGISPYDPFIPLTYGPQPKPLIVQIPQKASANKEGPTVNKKKPNGTATRVPILPKGSIMETVKPARKPPTLSATAAKTTEKPFADATPVILATKPKQPGLIRKHPTTNNMVEIAPASLDGKQKEDSSESLEDESSSTQYIVVGEESAGKKLSRNAYRQILNYFNRNRFGRQLNGDAIKEQLIPVQIVNNAEEQDFKDNLQTSTASETLADNSNKETE